MKRISFAMSQAAGIAINEVNANATGSVGAGGASSFAGLVLATRGGVNRVLSLTADNFTSVLGKPLHPRSGAAFEPYRHVQTAVLGGNGSVVRVPAPGMMIPGITLQMVTGTDGKTTTLKIANTAFAASATPGVPAGCFAMIYVDDGDASLNRKMKLVPDAQNTALYDLVLTETGDDGSDVVLESLQVSFDPEARDDMGKTAFISAALENNNSRLRAVLSSDALAQSLKAAVTSDLTPFIGGTDGDFTKVTSNDYAKALTVLKKSQANFTAILSLGCYDAPTLISLNQYAADCRVDMFYDLKGAQNSTDAIKEAKGHNLSGQHVAARYYFPYSAMDSYSSTSVVYGISCDAFVAKAKGVALVNDVGGWHYSPAGTSRAVLNRSGIAVLPNLDEPDMDAIYAARINTVSVTRDGSVYIDDSLTTYGKENYLRLQHISSLMNAIARDFYAIAGDLKHEPDGITQDGLTSAMTNLLERYYAANALVTPRDSSQGKEPFTVSVLQLDIDKWQVTWSVCPTGTSRRIVGVPVLLR